MIDAEDVCKTYHHLKGERGTWESHWEEIAQYILPRQMGFLGERTPGEKRTQRVFDSRPLVALDRFAAVMDSMLTPRQSRWHNLRTTDEALNRDHEVQTWLYQVNSILYSARYTPRTNFSGQNSERWISMGAFGTGALFIDSERQNGRFGLRYRCVHLRDMLLLENHQGVIDTVYRHFQYTARQAVQAFGQDKLPESILKCLDDPNAAGKQHDFIHVVMPREDYEEFRMDVRGTPFVSLYVALKDRVQVKESGYYSFPFSIGRYVTAPDEVYGRSPAMLALPDVKMLNAMSKTDIQAAHMQVRPPLLLHDDGILGNGAIKINMTPGGLIPGGVDRNGRQMVQPLNTGARLDISDAKMDQRRGAIDDAFLVTLFQILVETPRMTATEALIRAQEKGMLLTPTMGRQQSESLGPMIERELDLLARNDILPPMPPAMIEAGGEYEIVYDSPMSRMQRAEELVGVQRTMELLAPFAQLDPSVLDVFDQDELARLTAEVSGVPTTVLRSPEEVSEIRSARAQQEQAAAMVQSAQPIASSIKDVAQAQAALTQ